MKTLAILILAALVADSLAHIGSCEDHSNQCPKWESWGFCTTNLHFMALNCPVTCQVCVDPGCFDRNQLCSEWAQKGYCEGLEDVRKTCPHSCSLCLVPDFFFKPTGTKSITRPDFECGEPYLTASRRRFARFRRQIIFKHEIMFCRRQNRVSYHECLETVKFGSMPGEPAPARGEIGHGHSVSGHVFEEPDHVSKVPAHIFEEPGHGPEEEDHRHQGSVAPLSSGPLEVSDAFCGATLVHERFLLTAAHCVLDKDRPVRSVRLGELDFGSEGEANSKPADYQVKRILVHPGYKTSSLERYNDIALMETVERVQFNDVVYPLCVSDKRPADGSLVTGSGFGLVNSTFRATHVQEATLRMVNSHDCEDLFEREGLLSSLKALYPQLLEGKDIMCAAFPGVDACQGDSGGPLFQEDREGHRFLVGVISQGITCRGAGISTLPGFYISVADHIDFIDSVIYG